MPTTSRSRLIEAPPERLFEIVSDPHNLPRWWPRVTRVEAVHGPSRRAGASWTTVMETAAGKAVRADHGCTRSEPPGAYAWQQEVEGTPFERILREAMTTVTLEPAAGATEVTIAVRQRLRRFARLGVLQVKRATARTLDGALDGLERAL